ncbi:unnamed protein product [Phytophthora lilii]|uniref:Unnamed protein product n=1 Tax=Phytophthora lilii TaxID=2077276 RepID=A0A9W6U2T8_9STRA|nr:unnamed protein product [Phytophthora lilii]
MYAAQYRAEQSARQAAKAETQPAPTADADDAAATGEKRKRKADGGARGGRGKHCLMEEWEHFARLQDEGYIGKSNFFYAVCKHCQRAYDEADEERKPLLVPEKLVGRREKMRKHLALCPHFKGELPLMERRQHQRGNGLPPSVVLSALTAASLGASTNAAVSAELPATGAATARAAATVVPATNGSSRLALDEWHFFTRLERKKDSAYYYARCNFCQQAYENAPENMKATMEPTIITGRKSNMQTHLAKCLHMPKDPSVLAQIYSSTNPGGVSAVETQVDGSVPPSGLKRAKMDVANVSLVLSPDKTSVHRALVRFLIEHHLPFEWVESDSAKQLFRALVPAPRAMDELLPTTADFRTRILDETQNTTLLSELLKLQELIPLELGTSAFSSDTMDELAIAPVGSWPVMLHCTLSGDFDALAIEGIVTNGKAVVSLAFIRAQKTELDVEAALAHYHGLEVARWLDEHIGLCLDTVKLSLVVVVLPYNTITQRAIGILRAPTRWPQLTYLPDMKDLFQFPLLKLLATAEMFAVVSSLIEVWQLESIRSCVMERLAEIDNGAHASPFHDWKSCATLIQVILDEKTFEASTKRGAANAKKLVENALNRSLLERVYNLLHAFMNALSSCRTGLTLSEAMEHLGVLFTAAEGLVTVQLALEVIWEQMEQPLFLVAHALNPNLRLRDLKSTGITKLSTLTDLSVSYFTSFFGRKPSSLREEVTAYLHTSQRVFTREFLAEFTVVDDYFRYLSDNFPSLSMLMQVLHSFSAVSLVNSPTHPKQLGAKKEASTIYNWEEQQKLDYLRGRWGIASAANNLSLETQEGETKSWIAAHNDRSGAAMLNAGVVVDEWKEALESELHERNVDFSPLDDKFDGVDESDTAEVTSELGASGAAVAEQTTARGPKLPSLELDDELTFPSASLRAEFSAKVSLKDLFKTAEATI